MSQIKEVAFDNRKRPSSSVDLLRLEDLMAKADDGGHDITHIHRVEFYHILIATEGRGRHAIDFVDYDYEKGTVLLTRKDQVQRFYRSSEVKGYLLLFTEDFLAGHYSSSEALRSQQLFNELLGPPVVHLRGKHCREMLEIVEQISVEYLEHDDQFSTGVLRHALQMLMAKLARAKSESMTTPSSTKFLPDFLLFQELVEEHSSETRTVAHYAERMNSTPKRLNRITQSIVQKSAKEVIDEIAVARLKRLLIHTTLPIVELAYTSGFDEPTNMFKFFKRLTGTTPEAFRKMHS